MSEGHTLVGVGCIGLGLLFALLTWVITVSRRDLRYVILDLADHGPCTGLELKRCSSYAYTSVYTALHEAIEDGLVTVRYRMNSPTTAAARGELKTREFRLTTQGWQVATRLRAGGTLDEPE